MTGVEIKREIEREAGLALGRAVNTRTGEAVPVRIVRVALGRPGEETTETEITGVGTTEGGRDPTVDHAHPEGIGIKDIPETRMRRSFWVMMRLLMSLSGWSSWKSKVGVKSTRPL